MLRRRFRPLLALGALAAMFTVAADIADARGRVSIGSRGTRTHSAPPATTTAPAARPVESSTMQPGASAAPRPASPAVSTQARAPVQVSPVIVAPVRSGQQQQQPQQAANAQALPAANPPGFTGGFLGAGLFGLVLGAGLTGGLGGLASFLGLAFQIGILAAIGWALMGLMQGRGQTATEPPARGLQRPTDSRSTFGLRNAAPR